MLKKQVCCSCEPRQDVQRRQQESSPPLMDLNVSPVVKPALLMTTSPLGRTCRVRAGRDQLILAQP